MLSELNFWHGLADNPKKSRIAGKSTTILVPAGPGGSFPNVPTTSLAISKYSEKKQAAWLYIAWMTQQHIMLDGQMAAVPMCRRSSWEDPTYVAPTPAWGESAKIAADFGIAIAKPQAIAIGQMRDAAGEIVNVAIRDEKPRGDRGRGEEAGRVHDPARGGDREGHGIRGRHPQVREEARCADASGADPGRRAGQARHVGPHAATTRDTYIAELLTSANSR